MKTQDRISELRQDVVLQLKSEKEFREAIETHLPKQPSVDGLIDKIIYELGANRTEETSLHDVRLCLEKHLNPESLQINILPVELLKGFIYKWKGNIKIAPSLGGSNYVTISGYDLEEDLDDLLKHLNSEKIEQPKEVEMKEQLKELIKYQTEKEREKFHNYIGDVALKGSGFMHLDALHKQDKKIDK